MGFKFQLVSDGEVLGGFETAVPSWSAGDTLIASGNVEYRIVSVLPVERAAEFVEGALYGVLEVEPL